LRALFVRSRLRISKESCNKYLNINLNINEKISYRGRKLWIRVEWVT
jgi:hypothetical protein